ncbi:MAG: glycosyltransferase family 2 protein [Gemmatimonadales bacterium]
MTLLSLILPCRNEALYIGPCLDTLLATRYPMEGLEILVVDGMSDDGTRELVSRYAARYGRIRLLDNPRRVAPSALNIGIAAATGDVIARVDAHALYPPEYLPRLVRALEETGADNVGGPVVTLPANSGAQAQAISLALSHPLGVGNSWFRIGSRDARWVETVPFGCWRRELFRRIGGFDEELVRNQDDEFNYRTARAGGRILLLPEAVSYYFARDSLGQAARMMYQYGFYKPLVARKVGRVATLRQLAPPALVAGLIAGAALAPFWAPAAWLWAGVILLYALLVIAGALSAGWSRGSRVVAALLAAFPAMHFAYGWGYLRGLWGARAERRPRWRDPAAVPLTR